MLVTRKWLKMYIDRDFTPEEIAGGLTRAGIEVESIHEPGREISGVVVGEILSREKHPDADRLSVCRVDVGETEPVTIVCGAPNCDAGHKVPVAVVGAVLPGDFRIRVARLKGVESRGMICSASELGISASLLSETEREGIWILPRELKAGEDFLAAMGMDDVVFELGLTPNRSDCFGVINVARELAMIYNEPIRIPDTDPAGEDGEIRELVRVAIEDSRLSSRYVARMIRDIKVGPSPVWMQNLLRASGIRPISNIVDVTNFVMLETGQPLHAFDYNRLSGGEVSVRSAREGERLVTLDGQKRELTPDMIVIADREKPVALAGVMGGENSEVDAGTTTILLESAHFLPESVRRTSRRLGLRSEASGRFERGVSPEGSLYAASRALDLIAAMGAGTPVSGAVDAYPVAQPRYVISLRPDRVNRILGTNISPEEMKEYFSRLQFKVSGEDTLLEVEIPPYRMDITGEVDLVEEVARIYGYDRIPTTLPATGMHPDRKSAGVLLTERLRDILTGLGLSEIVTYAFISPESFGLLNLPADHEYRQSVRIMNPLSESQSVMRTTLLPGLLETAQRNFRRSSRDLALFETGRVFRPEDGEPLPRETGMLGMLLTGEKGRDWYGDTPEPDFFTLKGILETLASSLNTELAFEQEKDHPALHPGRSARILLDGRVVGHMGEVHPQVLDAYDLGQRTLVLEMEADAFLPGSVRVNMYHSLPRYPAVSRDIAFVIPVEVENHRIMETIARVAGDKLVDYRLFDLYQGSQIAEGYKSIAYTLTYQSMEKTLTDEEVSGLHMAVQEAVEQQLGARLRM